MRKEDIHRILDKREKGEPLSPEEQYLLDNYYLFIGCNSNSEIGEHRLNDNLEQIRHGLSRVIKPKKWRVWVSTAAALLILASSATYLYFYQQEYTSVNQQALFANIKPGTEQAILELANGERINLNTQILSSQSGTIQFGNETIDLEQKGINATDMNSLRTAAGGQFEVLLSDGTKVKMNAMSHLRYPSSFDGSERVVELVGEAYFEVAKNTKMPFKVKTSSQTIQVLGTGFNVSAYPNESRGVRTTLVHGKVAVSSNKEGQSPTILRPGEQAYDARSGIGVHQVDINQVIGWKDGLFVFNKSDLQSITEQLERWYDVKFVLKDETLQDRRITGTIPRNVSLYDVVEIFSFFDVQCSIHDRTVYLTTLNHLTE